MLELSERSLGLENLRQRLSRLNYISQYTSEWKVAVRKYGVQLLVDHSDDGYSLWNPEYSDEVVLYLEYSGRKLDTVVVTDYESEVIRQLRTPYFINGIFNLHGLPLHEAVKEVPGPIACGHFDYMGEFNSPKTRTLDTIQNLNDRMADKACFAFTHCDNFRNTVDDRRKWGRALYEEFSLRFPSSLPDWLNPLGPITSVNAHPWFSPTVLTWACAVLVHYKCYHVDVQGSIKYRQQVSRGNTYMNKVVLSFERGQFDIEKSVNSLIANRTQTIN